MRQQRGGGLWKTVRRSWWPLVVCGLAVASAPIFAHHSFATYYFEEDSIEVEGDVVEFQYRNPHAFLQVAGQDAFGKPTIWTAEWASASRLDRDGITKTTLRPGDSVRIWGSPSRDAKDSRIHLKRIERRSDGWKWGRTRREPR